MPVQYAEHVLDVFNVNMDEWEELFDRLDEVSLTVHAEFGILPLVMLHSVEDTERYYAAARDEAAVYAAFSTAVSGATLVTFSARISPGHLIVEGISAGPVISWWAPDLVYSFNVDAGVAEDVGESEDLTVTIRFGGEEEERLAGGSGAQFHPLAVARA